MAPAVWLDVYPVVELNADSGAAAYAIYESGGRGFESCPVRQ
jgi:hypothetical protein